MANKSAAVARLLAFFLPSLIILAAFFSIGVFPFGDKSVLIMDMSDQYVEFLAGLRSGDLFFSWSKALGGNYIGIFAYYASSPLSLLTLLFPTDMMPTAVLLLTVLKIGLAGLAFCLFLQYRFGKESQGTVIFSMLYALSSYNVGYSMGIMWLDGVIWLPIMLLGIERVLEGRSARVLTVALLASFVSNYYISYMAGLFTALYYVYRCLELGIGWKAFWRSTSRFALSVLAAAGLGAFLLLPTMASLFEGKIGAAAMDYSSPVTFSPLDLLTRLLPGSYDSITNTGMPFIYSGMVAQVLVLLFFCSKTIATRSKWLTAGLLTLLLLSMWVSALDKAWHVFQYPNWFPYRYAFVLALLVVLTAYRALHATGRIGRTAIFLLFVVCMVDMFINATGILRGLDKEFGYKSNASYVDQRRELEPLIARAAEDNQQFQRLGTTFERSKNEAIGFGYHGLTHYSSAYNRSVNQLLRQLGFAQTYFWSSYFGSTMVTDTVFGVRHVIAKEEVSPYYTEIARGTEAVLYQNPYAISLGATVPRQALEGFRAEADVFATQNRLVQALVPQAGAVFVMADADVGKQAAKAGTDAFGETIFEITGTGLPLYAYFEPRNGAGKLFVNGQQLSDLYTSETSRIHYLGTPKAGEALQVKVMHEEEANASFYWLDVGAFELFATELQAKAMVVDTYDRTGLQAHVKADEDEVLFTTIPYDAGWRVWVDGKEANIERHMDALLAILLSAGDHELRLHYSPKGLREGIVVSIATALLVAGFELLAFRRRRKA